MTLSNEAVDPSFFVESFFVGWGTMVKSCGLWDGNGGSVVSALVMGWMEEGLLVALAW